MSAISEQTAEPACFERADSKHFCTEQSGFLNLGQLQLKAGGCLGDLRVAYRLRGDTGRPVVCVLGGISANRDAFTRTGKGWWQTALAHSPLVDPKRYCLLTIDYLGASGESTTGQQLQALPNFEHLSVSDQALALVRVLDALHIQQLRALVGASYGGMVAQQFAINHSERVAELLVINCAHRSSKLGTAWRHIQREIIRLGARAGADDEALRLARALAIVTYRGEGEFDQRFDHASDPSATLESYLFYQSQDIKERLNAAAYLCLSTSIDQFSVKPEQVATPCNVVSTDSDQLVTPKLVQEFCHRLPALRRALKLKSNKGHDAFLAEAHQINAIFNEIF